MRDPRCSADCLLVTSAKRLKNIEKKQLRILGIVDLFFNVPENPIVFRKPTSLTHFKKIQAPEYWGF